MSISDNLQRLNNEIADACARSHRERETVALMAVSKVQPAEALLEAYACGHRLFGENRVQEWQSKRLQLSEVHPLPTVHLIGPLQNNKTSKAAEIFDAIDTLDSIKTAERLNAAALAIDKTIPVLVEIKLSHEESKYGIDPAALPDFLNAIQRLEKLQVRGLMTVPPFDPDAERARPYFQRLRSLRDENQQQFPMLTELSMGMSNDFVVAIEEGSTTVRIGTAIFGKRQQP